MRRQLEIYDEIKVTPETEQRNELFKQILEIAKEDFLVIGIGLPDGAYGIVKNGFGNLPNTLIYGWVYPLPGPTYPEQYALLG